MSDLDHVLSQLSEVRSHLATATRFHGLAPQAVGLSAAIAAAAAILQSVVPAQLNPDTRTYVLYWSAVAALATGIIAAEALGRARRAHGGRAGRMIDGALRLLLPSCIAGAAITFVLWKTAPEVLWLMPGIWQVLIALTGFSALPMLSPEMRWAGLFYLASGIGCLMLAKDMESLSPWLMGVPFAVGQSIVALVLHRANEAHGG